MLLIFSGAVILLLCVAVAASFMVKQLPQQLRVKSCTVIYTLLFTPSWAPATIVVVPLPFGIIIGIGTITGAPGEIIDLLLLFWWWHLPAFIIFGFISYKVANKLVGVSSESENHR